MSIHVDWSFIVREEGDWSIGYVPNVTDQKGRVRSGTTIVSGFDLGQQDAESVRRLNLSPQLTAKLLPFVGQKGPSAVMAEQRSFEGAMTTLLRLNHPQAGVRATGVGAMQPIGVMGGKTGPLRQARPGEKPTQFIAPANTVLRLELDSAEHQELTQAVRKSFFMKLARQYDLAAKGPRFSTLPGEIQTALLSLSWHTGNIWGRHHSAREVFDAAVRQDWPDVIDNLRGGEIFTNPRYFKFRDRRRAEAALVGKATNIGPTQIGPKERAYLEHLIEIGGRKARAA